MDKSILEEIEDVVNEKTFNYDNVNGKLPFEAFKNIEVMMDEFKKYVTVENFKEEGKTRGVLMIKGFISAAEDYIKDMN